MRLPRLLAIGFLVVQSSLPVHAQATDLEYDVKAAFLLNFTRYVDWPATRPPMPFRMCVLGANPFGHRLDSIVAGERWRDGAITVRVVHDVTESADCDLLYVPADGSDRFISDRRPIAGKPVLTVGETRRFFTGGGMIQLFVQEGKVRFSINQRSALAAGLTISSRLLRLARELIPPEPVP